MLARTLESLGATDDRRESDRLLRQVGGLSAVHQLFGTSDAVFDVVDSEPEIVRQWLRAWPIAEDEQVTVTWPADRTAVRMEFYQFADHIDDLWYPAQDDVVVLAGQAGAVDVLVLDHEERVVFGRLPNVATDVQPAAHDRSP